jgi:uncharacterized protein (TIGR02246 family)
MDLHAQTRTTLPATPEDTARQVRALADRVALSDLVALYAMALDDHDLPTVLDCFAPDGRFTRFGATAAGPEELRACFTEIMDRYVMTLHVPDTQVASVDTDAGTAHGVTTSHAELALDGRLLVAAFRYEDDYVRRDGRWVFQSRALRFVYTVPVEQMATSFADNRRIRLPGAPHVAADIPESSTTWETYGLA